MTAAKPDLLDLRDYRQPELLAAFTRLYDETFTDPSEREDPADWPHRLWASSGDTRMHLLVTRAEDGRDISAGLAFEYFPISHCGLLTYLAVRPEWRRRGLARVLVNRAIEVLAVDSHEDGATLQAAFAETESPLLVPPEQSAIPPVERLRAFEKLGARWIDLPYVQPALTPDGSRCRHLLLIAFPIPKGPAPDADTVLTFLEELYAALGVDDPDRDPDFVAMRRALGNTLVLKPLSEVTP